MVPFLHTFIIITTLIDTTNSANISPTSTDATTEYYVSHNESEWKYGTIICNENVATSNCVVQCNDQLSCSFTTINATHSHNLTVICSALHSCVSADIICPIGGLCHILCTNHDVPSEEERCTNLNIIAYKTINTTLHCIGTDMCNNLALTAYLNEYILISADGPRALAYANLKFTSSIIVDIICNHDYYVTTYADFFNAGCDASNFYLDYVDKVYIECQFEWDCDDSVFHGYNANYLQLLCRHDEACKGVIMKCPSQNANQCVLGGFVDSLVIKNNNDHFAENFIGCHGCHGSIKSVCNDEPLPPNIYIEYKNYSQIYYSPYNDRYECTDYDCCPFTKKIYQCDYNEDCIIDCDAIDCVNSQINAQNASSLIISCIKNRSSLIISGPFSGTGGCVNAEINCPMTMNSVCDIYCNDTAACREASIYYNNANNITLDCMVEYSCYNTYINVLNPDAIMQLHCNGSSSCENIIVNTSEIETVFVNCHQYDESTGFANYFAPCLDAIFYLNSTNNIDINCADFSCYRSNIFAAKSNILNVSCSYHGCYDVLIDATQSMLVDISCEDSHSCYYMDAYLPSTSHSSSLYCAYAASSCQFVNIFVSDDYEYEFLDLHCFGPAHLEVCDDMKFTCIESGDVVSINPDYNGCYTTAGCCPFPPDNITCNNIYNNNCHMSCENSECQNKLIISPINALTVDCTSISHPYEANQQCLGTIIKCPAGDCIVNCDGEQACWLTTIIADVGTNLYINCINGSWTCYEMNIEAQNANNVSIDCDGPTALSEHHRSTNDKASCYYVGIYAENANNVNIKCAASMKTEWSRYACDYLLVDANYANKVVIETIGSYALRDSNISASYSPQFSIACRNDIGNPDGERYSYSDPDPWSACYSVNLFGSDSSNLICEGYGCGYLLLHSEHGLDDWTIDWNGCGYCNSAENCMDYKFDIYCVNDDGSTSNDAFYGDSDVYCDCCGSEPSEIKDSFYTNYDTCSLGARSRDNVWSVSGFELSIFLAVALFMLIIFPFIGLIYFNKAKPPEPGGADDIINKPSILILIYVLFANFFIFIANCNLLYRSIVVHKKWTPFCEARYNTGFTDGCYSDDLCGVYNIESKSYVLDAEDNDCDHEDCVCQSSEKMFAYYTTLAVFLSVATFIELIRNIDGITIGKFININFRNKRKENIDTLTDSLLVHCILWGTNKNKVNNELILGYWNLREYWNFKHWSFIAITLLTTVPIWITSMFCNVNYGGDIGGIQWYEIYPVIVLYFVIIVVKVRYRNGTPYTHPSLPKDFNKVNKDINQLPIQQQVMDQEIQPIQTQQQVMAQQIQPIQTQEPIANVATGIRSQQQQTQMVMLRLPNGQMVMAQIGAQVPALSSTPSAPPVNIEAIPNQQEGGYETIESGQTTNATIEYQ